jgi:RimJ/RimL family protein N-acetyltransferase
VAAVLYQGRTASVRRLERQDIRSLYAQPEVRQAIASYKPGQTLPDDAEAAAARIEWLATMDPPVELEVLVERASDSAPIGFMCMSSFDPSNGKAEFSAAFFRSQGSRAALEAMHWVVETAFMHQGLFKLIFHVLPTNLQALRAVEAFGGGLEALLRHELQLPDGQRSHLLRYCLFRDAWEKSEPRRRLQRLAPLAAPAAAVT